MLKIKQIDLSETAEKRLVELQDKVNKAVDKPAEADKLWDSKGQSLLGQNTFTEIRETLSKMCVGVQICNYCEQSEASDIEHIMPKSLFPEHSFVWKNYLLACKKCNTTHKSDLIDVFVPAGSTTPQRVARQTVPPTKDIAFIQIRIEDPLYFLELNFEDFMFYEKFQKGTREYEKANKTLEILELNTRETLKKSRKNAFGDYKRLLAEYVKVSSADTFEAIDKATEGNPALNRSLPFEDEKRRVLSALSKSILEYAHPTVFVEMQRQIATLPVKIQEIITDYLDSSMIYTETD